MEHLSKSLPERFTLASIDEHIEERVAYGQIDYKIEDNCPRSRGHSKSRFNVSNNRVGHPDNQKSHQCQSSHVCNLLGLLQGPQLLSRGSGVVKSKRPGSSPDNDIDVHIQQN